MWRTSSPPVSDQTLGEFAGGAFTLWRQEEEEEEEEEKGLGGEGKLWRLDPPPPSSS